jgi:5-methylthioribose kinase
MVYREVNAVLFVCAKGLVPVLSAIVGTNLALSVRAQPLLSNEVMIWASIAIVIFSGLDTVLNPREKKAIALKVNLELCAIKEAFLIGVENAKTQEEFQKVLEVTSEKLRKVLSDYAAKGWGA